MTSVGEIYRGSDGRATQILYKELEQFGTIGLIAVNLFRAQKYSSRAKVYHGGIPGKGSYKGMAYDRKQWSMDQLCLILIEHAEASRIIWGWKTDPAQEYHVWVLYVDLPTGQVSFHTRDRGTGPDYPGEWDGEHASADRIIRFVESLRRDENDVEPR